MSRKKNPAVISLAAVDPNDTNLLRINVQRSLPACACAFPVTPARRSREQCGTWLKGRTCLGEIHRIISFLLFCRTKNRARSWNSSFLRTVYLNNDVSFTQSLTQGVRQLEPERNEQGTCWLASGFQPRKMNQFGSCVEFPKKHPKVFL